MTRAAEAAAQDTPRLRTSRASSAAAPAKTTGMPSQKTTMVIAPMIARMSAPRGRSLIRGTITQKTTAVTTAEIARDDQPLTPCVIVVTTERPNRRQNRRDKERTRREGQSTGRGDRLGPTDLSSGHWGLKPFAADAESRRQGKSRGPRFPRPRRCLSPRQSSRQRRWCRPR